MRRNAYMPLCRCTLSLYSVYNTLHGRPLRKCHTGYTEADHWVQDGFSDHDNDADIDDECQSAWSHSL